MISGTNYALWPTPLQFVNRVCIVPELARVASHSRCFPIATCKRYQTMFTCARITWLHDSGNNSAHYQRWTRRLKSSRPESNLISRHMASFQKHSVVRDDIVSERRDAEHGIYNIQSVQFVPVPRHMSFPAYLMEASLEMCSERSDRGGSA